ncbi:2OG-Fe(II) oxygenase [Xanthomonas sp. AmX2]|uniref:2OG-Fe(II) oxygenase n=1 Tax=Xanthomonas sp. TaxID=29446 RepID=UPI00197D65B0|nr:2OG-Fe(II) oxygenase [Xanthomonas sp.]MBN6150784.1 2OG-Fe(II) oxygenase [Xanthomonas sp.]
MQLEHSILKKHCPHLAVIDVAARMAGQPVSSAEVALKGAPRWYRDKFTLQHAADALAELGVQTLGFRADATQLRLGRLPVLAQIRLNGAHEFVVVARIDGQSVLSYNGSDGWWLEAWSDFVARWTGVCLALGDDRSSGTGATLDRGASHDLALRLVEEFISEQECRQLVGEADPLFRRSMVSADGSLHSEVRSSGRTSQSASCSGPLCDSIVRRAAALIGVEAERFEPLQCVRYEAGEKFSPHYDVPVARGDRASRGWTMLAYLNDGFEGGETLFPLLDLRVRPKRGGLLMFRNRRSAGGDVEGSALHAGMAVAGGVKYACNIWCADPA